MRRFPAMLAVMLLTVLAGQWLLSGCSSPSRFDNALAGPQAPAATRKRMVLTFERESTYAALPGREVSVSVKAPSSLVAPGGGRTRTDGAGRVEILVDPAAVYDRSALKSGDIVVDYPAELTVVLTDGPDVYEWDLDGHDSFARYQDPLYGGLDRDPDPAVLNLTLTVP
ncbi:MAG: hypothetical protein LBP95_03885 [Deltaproteobacteria bacterium]|nr:hypothetical protein [Deltaproteobacteria bacterium]